VGFETALALHPYVSLLRDVIIILIGGFSKKLGVLELGECRGVKPLCRGLAPDDTQGSGVSPNFQSLPRLGDIGG